MTTNEMVVGYLNYLVKTYKGVTKLVTSTKQRLLSLPGEDRVEDFDPMLKGEKNYDGLESVKGRISRAIEKELPKWEIWERWLKHIPGIGPVIAGELILTYYYKFIPVCKDCGGILDKTDGTLICRDCGKESKEGGLLKHRLELRDYQTISKWWAYMGRHTVDGVMPKRKKGTLANWSTPGRTLGYQIGDQFNRQDENHPYKAFMIDRKMRHQARNPEWSKGHVHNAARNEAVKLFLSHFWVVARTLDGKDVSQPYAGAIMGHTNIIEPFYWEARLCVKPRRALRSKKHGKSVLESEI